MFWHRGTVRDVCRWCAEWRGEWHSADAALGGKGSANGVVRAVRIICGKQKGAVLHFNDRNRIQWMRLPWPNVSRTHGSAREIW